MKLMQSVSYVARYMRYVHPRKTPVASFMFNNSPDPRTHAQAFMLLKTAEDGNLDADNVTKAAKLIPELLDGCKNNQPQAMMMRMTRNLRERSSSVALLEGSPLLSEVRACAKDLWQVNKAVK